MKLGAGILYTDGKQVLLLHRSEATRAYPHTWASTGGGIEEGEDYLEAAKRESKEEIGTLQGNKIAEFTADPFVMYIFKVDKPFSVKLNNEHTEARWVSLDEVANYKLHPNFKKEWPKYLKSISKKRFAEWLSLRN